MRKFQKEKSFELWITSERMMTKERKWKNFYKETSLWMSSLTAEVTISTFLSEAMKKNLGQGPPEKKFFTDI